MAAGAQLALLALWFGAASFFSVAVAPAAFSVLPSRELAGALVGWLLPPLFWAGALLGPSVVALELARGEKRFRRSRIAGAAVVMVSCLIAQLAVAPRIAALRATMSAPLASLPADDAQRILFGRLHMMSVGWLALAMTAAVATALLVLLTLRSRGKA